jgi:hypothetical protein
VIPSPLNWEKVAERPDEGWECPRLRLERFAFITSTGVTSPLPIEGSRYGLALDGYSDVVVGLKGSVLIGSICPALINPVGSNAVEDIATTFGFKF